MSVTFGQPRGDDLTYLRRTYEIAAAQAAEGHHPFAAILVGADGRVLLEQANAFHPHGDMTGHAERVLMTRASTTLPPEALKGATMYISAEPCAMCAGSIYWVGVERIVYGLSEAGLKALTGDHPENPTLDLPCHIVFEAGQRDIEIVGPLLEEEGAALHETFWSR